MYGLVLAYWSWRNKHISQPKTQPMGLTSRASTRMLQQAILKGIFLQSNVSSFCYQITLRHMYISSQIRHATSHLRNIADSTSSLGLGLETLSRPILNLELVNLLSQFFNRSFNGNSRSNLVDAQRRNRCSNPKLGLPSLQLLR